mgnify:CR=1 FL=1
MIGRTNAGFGGGGSLYYDVKCQAAEPAKKEGRIWVKSSVPMTAVEWANDPWTSGAVGRVDIGGVPGGSNPTSANSTIMVFNVKRAGIWEKMKLTPTFCRQVQGSTGNWVDVDAYVCHSDTWVQFSYTWDGTLLSGSNQYTAITGGWGRNANNVGSDNNGWAFYTMNSIDVTRFSTLNIKANFPACAFYRVGLASKSGGVTQIADSSWVAYSEYYAESSRPDKSIDVNIDVSSLSGKYYVNVTAFRYAAEYTIDNVSYVKLS